MSSLIPGYEYDIFISYRHKDNKYDGWVTTFVDDLHKELEATFKEEATIYFDQNPHDGLHENHDVDDSLKDKIRCLIFIPIVSRTYCDPKSFAWNKEFLGFRDFAAQDRLGLKIKLANANVSSRILPVRIHDLDQEDIQLYEREAGTVLRPIDFIFKSSGVSRPLAHHDERKDNLNHTYYRDQINKVAIAIKDIVAAAKHTSMQAEAPSAPSASPILPKKGLSIQKMVMPAIIVILLGIIGYGTAVFLNHDKVQAAAPGNVNTTDRSIAVLPFADMSAANDQEYFSDGLSEELLNLLAKIPSLKVISRTSAFSFKGKNEDIRLIGEKLGVAYLLEGSVRKAGDKVRITAQLIKASDGSHLWSETFDRDMYDIFKVQDEIANAVVAKLKGQLLGSISTPLVNNPEAYNLYLESKFYRRKGTVDALLKAIELAKKALRVDSADVRVLAELSSCHIELWSNSQDRESAAKYYEEGYSAAERALALAPNLPDGYLAMGFVRYIKSEFAEASKYYQRGLDLDPANTRGMVSLAMVLTALGDFSKAESLCRKSIELDPLNSGSYTRLSNIQLGTGDFD